MLKCFKSCQSVANWPIVANWTSEKYKNGSSVFLYYFLNETKDKLLSTHKAMKLFSKKTNSDYFVVMKSQYRKKFSPEDERSLDEALDKLLV